MTGLDIRDSSLTFVKRYYWLILFAWVTLVAGLAASEASSLVETGLRNAIAFVMPPPPEAKPVFGVDIGRRPQSDYAPIARRNLFNKNPPPKFGEQPPVVASSSSGPVVETNLQVALLATVVGKTPEKSLALIVDKTDPSAVEAYRIGDKVMSIAEVVEIERGKVILINRGQRETLSLEESVVPGTPVSPAKSFGATDMRNRLEERREQLRRSQDKKNKPNQVNRRDNNRDDEDPVADDTAVVEVEEGVFEIDSQYMEDTLENIGKLMTQARVVPNMVMGQIKGYKIFAIKPASLYMRLGLKNGDIIERINGIEIKTPDKALSLLQELRYERSFELDYVRQGQKITNNYTVR